MGLFSKHKGRRPVPCTFSLHCHTLAPVPPGLGSLLVAFQRGSHSCATRPAPASSPRSGEVHFDETISLPATLYEVPSISAAGGDAGNCHSAAA